ncbi:MAG: hypothetical protein ABSE45_07275 [Candidatus Acidiferrales bacterium]|jgi:hypothetical protein
MTSEDRRAPLHTFTRSTALIPGAALLILVGVVLQLGELGYGRLNLDNFWMLSVISSAICSLFDACIRSTALAGMFQFWPLVLVVIGCAILMSGPQSSSRPRGKVVPEARQEHE